MSLWAFVCSVHLCKSVRNKTHPRYEMRLMWLAGEFYLSQSAQSSLSFFAHGFESTERLRHTEFTEAFQLRLAITFCDIGWLNVSVRLCVFCSSVFSVRKNMSFFICHYVILSYKNHQFLSVPLLFCLQKNISLLPSLCYSVFKTTPSVTSVPLLLCPQNYPVYLCH